MKKLSLIPIIFLWALLFMSTSAVAAGKSEAVLLQAANGSIRGAVFLDSNGNGLWEANEPALSGIYVTVYSTGDWSHAFATGKDGTYAAVALSPSYYTVELTLPAGYVATTRTRIEGIAIGGDAAALSLNNNFGIAPLGTTLPHYSPPPPYGSPHYGSPHYGQPYYGQSYTVPATTTVTTTYSGRIYTVKAGDTLFRIALNHGVSLHALRAANGLHGNLIYAGQQLLIPDTKVISTTVTTVVVTPTPPPAAPTYKFHVVKAGENLYRIARYYGVPLHQLAAANNILNPSLIYVGQVLVIP